ncbi:MAG: UDP-N-acetylmuramoyl-tripeptide--D-alanyl-D-alanine ligase [Ignavibacteria bacterium]
MKKVRLNIEDVFEIPTARIYSPDDFKPVSHITIDSRKIRKGSLFIAIKGKRFDGHEFVGKSVKNGASAVVINRRNLNEFDNIDIPIITVTDTTKALGYIANMWRRKLNTKIIGITGSTGKTTTKDMLATLLEEKYKVNKTISNNNNHIGVPITILSTNERHDLLVSELGTNHFGEIEYSANILEPDYSLITNIGNSHLKYLKNKRGVLKEKSKLFDITDKHKGKLFINYDDPMLKDYSQRFDEFFSFGFSRNADVSGKITGYTNDGRPVVRVKYKNRIIENTLPLYGEQSASSYLAAVAIAFELGLSNKHINEGTKKLAVTGGRLKVLKKKNAILIDDSYNASPDSMKSAIDLAKKIKSYKRKVLILGDMLELGKDRIKLHQSLANQIINTGIDEVYSIGSSMRSLTEKLNSPKIIARNFRTRKSLLDFLNTYEFANKVILVKGSRGMRMEEFSEAILNKVKN